MLNRSLFVFTWIAFLIPTLGLAQPKLSEFKGCFLWKRVGVDEIHANNEKRCKERHVPFSTFKLPNTLIGLETGAVTPETIIKWDGKPKFLKEWEQDHNLSSAIKVSCVPFYQEVARRVGFKKMQEWINRLNYGNKKIGKVIDQFWLQGPLEISPYEQLAFMEKLYTDKLPVQYSHASFLRSIIVREEEGARVLSGKTGSTRENNKATQGWFVGHLKNDQRQYVFVIYEKGNDGISGAVLFEKAKNYLAELKL